MVGMGLSWLIWNPQVWFFAIGYAVFGLTCGLHTADKTKRWISFVGTFLTIFIIKGVFYFLLYPGSQYNMLEGVAPQAVFSPVLNIFIVLLFWFVCYVYYYFAIKIKWEIKPARQTTQ
jgi:hypothetical protein